MDSLGFEPRASAYFTLGFKVMKPFGCKGSALPAELRAPHRDIARYTQQSIMHFRYNEAPDGPQRILYDWANPNNFSAPIDCISLGGDPAADSPTATLLRLNPPCETQVRMPQ